ncbi:MAG: hypothetical protein OXR68_01425 [Alphaproteobacteria bacterium]|nr:hypothetical protein [Alphaproteobacteria bacterium]MDD9919272.1 hypothetical protein [Alphaproteobacteria bacterium]
MKKQSEGRLKKIERIQGDIIRVMTNPEFDGATQKQLAKAVGITPQTLKKYLTPEVWAEVKQRRLHIVHAAVGDVDRAVLAKALQGNLTAARLIYKRWDKLQEELKTDKKMPTTLEEIDGELEQLRTEVALLEKEG